MVGAPFRALRAEPRPARPPDRVWRDWALIGVFLLWSAAETVFRGEAVWQPAVLAVAIAVTPALLWRRTHPLAAVVGTFGLLTVVDAARVITDVEAELPSSVATALVLPYALFRWGAGREAGAGLAVVLVWLAVTHVADPTGPAEVVAGYGFFLFSAALGAAIRYYANARLRDIEHAKLRQRNELARELHDAVGHHVSAIAIQAQAGRALAASAPERAVEVLRTIEEEASRTLAEMRAMVGALRDGAEPSLTPQPGVADIQRLARDVGGGPRVDVQVSEGVAEVLEPAVSAACYRIAQESVTNAVRHARHATRITVRVVDEGGHVRVTVHDDGDAVPAGFVSPAYGVVGMTERVGLLGGTVRAGPGPDRGWIVDAVLPKGGTA